MRELYRSVARNRLKEMGVRKVNKHFGQGIPHSLERGWQRNPRVYQHVLALRKLHPANWRRALWGDLAKLHFNKKRSHRRRKGA